MAVDPMPGAVFGEPAAGRVTGLRRYLRRERADTDVRTAFVLAGGGNRGAAQVGMLRALVQRDIRPDVVFGSSVGAVNAAGFVADPTERGVERMATIWRGITSEDVFPHGRVPAPWRFLQQRESVHPNDGLRRIVELGAGIDRFEDAVIPLQVVATSLADGKARWFSSGSVTDAVLASSALPSLLPPVRIDGEVFIDGGVVDNVPIMRAIEQGCSRVFVLLCGPLHYTPVIPRRPVEAVLTGFFIAVHTRFARERENLPSGVEVIVFCVGTEPMSRYDDFSSTEAFMAAGCSNALDVIDFWSAGGRGEVGVPPGRLPRPDPAAGARQETGGDGRASQRVRVPAPPA